MRENSNIESTLLAPVDVNDVDVGWEDGEDSSVLHAFGEATDCGFDEDSDELAVEVQIKKDLQFALEQRVGPLLAQLREQQEGQGTIGNRESYSVEHLRRLYQFAPKRPYNRPSGRKEYCSKVHEKPCQLGCQSCHFCRQRTTEAKTHCSRCAGRNNWYGGPGRGILCGSCLSGRFGENIDEVLQNPDWLCPCCRDICNCSGVNCMRLKRGWFPTNQLSREALDQGYKSVAHYLILTHLSEHASVESIGVGLIKARRARRAGLGERAQQNNSVPKRNGGRQRNAQNAAVIDFDDLKDADDDLHEDENENTDENTGSRDAIHGQPRPKEGRQPFPFRGATTRRDALELVTKPRLEREVTNILLDLSNTDNIPTLLDSVTGLAPRLVEHTRFLCLLDEDDCGEDDEDDDHDDDDTGGNVDGVIGGPISGYVASAARRLSSKDPCTTSLGLPIGTSGRLQAFHTTGENSGVVDSTAVNSVLYRDGGVPQMINTVSVFRLARKSAATRVCDDMLPPKQPSNKKRRLRNQGSIGRGGNGAANGNCRRRLTDKSRASPDVETAIVADTEVIGIEAEARSDDDSIAPDGEDSGDDVFWVEEGDHSLDVQNDDGDKANSGDGEGNKFHPIVADARLDAPGPLSSYHKCHRDDQHAASTDEFVWNGLCLRATSIVDAVKTFYQFHPDVENYTRLQNAESDRRLYVEMYESTRAGLKRVLKSAEGMLAEESVIYYQSCGHIGSSSHGKGSNIHHDRHRIFSIGGLRRAVQLFLFLSRILPEEDVTWRIEKRLLGKEPFANFKRSSPHAKAILLRGWLEFVAILKRRGMMSEDALICIGDALAFIASEMKAVLPLMESIVENRTMPTDDLTISGWSYDEEARGKKLVEVFADLSVLYASLQEVFIVGVERATEASVYLGPKSHHMLTEPLVKALLDPQGSFSAPVIRKGFTLICTIVDLAFKTFEDESMNMTAEERNILLQNRNKLLDLIESAVIPDLETLVQLDYIMWAPHSARNKATSMSINPNDNKQGIGSEKVEVLARCYALRLRAGRATWAEVESKATEPYSFLQYWKYANLRYRHFSLYLLAHALERAPFVLQQTPASHGRSGIVGHISMHIFTILRMWLLAVLDFGRHECAWYLTTILSKHTRFVPTPVDFRGDKSGRKAANMLTGFARCIAGDQGLIRGVVLALDECLQERQREIVQTAYNAERAIFIWHRSTSRALIAFLSELQADMRREKELMKLLRRCVIWSIHDLSSLKASADGEKVSDGAHNWLEGLGLSVSGRDGAVRPDCTEGDLRQALNGFEFERLVTILPRALDDETECHEPLWIFISGIIGLGDASIAVKPFEHVLYDRVAASLFAAASPSQPGGVYSATGVPLHRHVLGTHIRRVLARTNFTNSQNERLGVSAMRLVRAIITRPEMRSKSAFQTVFNMMLTTWIGVLSQSTPAGDSLAVRFELIELLKDSIKLHGSLLVSSPLYHEFWKVVCSECLRMVSARFPEAVWPSILMEAEFIYCRLLSTFPGLESFVPSTPAILSAAYNNALSELGRPPSIDVLDSINGSNSLVDILPRVYGVRQCEGSLRPGNFAWNLAKASIGLLDAILDVNVYADHYGEVGDETTGAGSMPVAPRTPMQSLDTGAWYALCCLPYLESVSRKGERAFMLIREEFELFFDKLESKVPGVRGLLPPKEDQPAAILPTKPPVSPSTGPGVNRMSGGTQSSGQMPTVTPTQSLNRVLDVEHMELNTTFDISGKLSKIRKLQRDGVKVAACTLCDTTDASLELSVLVSKPEKLVASLLDMSAQSIVSKLPQKVLFRKIELVRKKNPVARSTAMCSLEELSERPDKAGSGTGSGTGRPSTPAVFIEASKELVHMGYSLDLVTTCLQSLQKHAQALSKEMIVSRVIGMLND